MPGFSQLSPKERRGLDFFEVKSAPFHCHIFAFDNFHSHFFLIIEQTPPQFHEKCLIHARQVAQPKTTILSRLTEGGPLDELHLIIVFCVSPFELMAVSFNGLTHYSGV